MIWFYFLCIMIIHEIFAEREVAEYEENEIFYAFDMPYSLVLLLLREIDRGAQEMGGG